MKKNLKPSEYVHYQYSTVTVQKCTYPRAALLNSRYGLHIYSGRRDTYLDFVPQSSPVALAAFFFSIAYPLSAGI